MTELREDTEHAANGQFATKGGGDGLIGKSLGAKHDVLRTPEVHAQMAKMYKQAAPTMLKGTSLHQEYSFTVDKKSGKPSKIESSDESNKNHFVKPDDPVTAIVHTHPDGTLPTPGPGDPLAAVLVDAPNYELSQKELWVVQPDGTQEQVGTVEWKHGDIVITPMSGERSLPFNYSDNPNPKQPVPDSSVASGTDRGVSNSVAEVPSPAGPSSDPYKRVLDFFNTIAEDEPEWQKDLRDNIMEMFRDAFTDNMGAAVPQTEYKPLSIGYGNVGGTGFPEACAFELMLGPQGEPLFEPREPLWRYSPDQPRDPDGKFGSGSGGLEAALKDWRGSVDLEDKRADIDAAIKSSDPASNVIVAGVRAETFEGSVYRGVRVDTEDGAWNEPLQWKEGDDIQLSPCSFSTDKSVADAFSKGQIVSNVDASPLDKSERSVVIEIEHGGNGISLIAHNSSDKEETEVISGGRYHVAKVETDGQSVHVTLHQTGVF